MSNKVDPITQAAIDNARELGLVLSELNEAEIMARAHAMRAQAHAELWSHLFRFIGRLFGRSQARVESVTPVQATPAATQDLANDNDARLAA